MRGCGVSAVIFTHFTRARSFARLNLRWRRNWRDEFCAIVRIIATIARLYFTFSRYVGARLIRFCAGEAIVAMVTRVILRKHRDFALYPFVDLSISGSPRDKI